MKSIRLAAAGSALALLCFAAGCGPKDDSANGKVGTAHFAHGHGPSAQDLERLAAHKPGSPATGAAQPTQTPH